jgi:hypothetical protein
MIVPHRKPQVNQPADSKSLSQNGICHSERSEEYTRIQGDPSLRSG